MEVLEPSWFASLVATVVVVAPLLYFDIPKLRQSAIRCFKTKLGQKFRQITPLAAGSLEPLLPLSTIATKIRKTYSRSRELFSLIQTKVHPVVEALEVLDQRFTEAVIPEGVGVLSLGIIWDVLKFLEWGRKDFVEKAALTFAALTATACIITSLGRPFLRSMEPQLSVSQHTGCL
ncbi:hypothetical protein BV898_03906 [Hypsibius exemplaris]|uniref:Uncharacterized protein n=1 Tax=Hypsibius exemplaris TaxID=2072580 RepID=A0A1W0X3I2_HYPEX|nr:hypothetical protein BV898_03906 [Hypsibius exemplaris]